MELVIRKALAEKLFQKLNREGKTFDYMTIPFNVGSFRSYLEMKYTLRDLNVIMAEGDTEKDIADREHFQHIEDMEKLIWRR